eukprot:TRINITY_DN92705_c0_g1_i1.p1 TRINITY_DN92705_c0_g1~~TRINITY_DN92705_c0_g1_i1.p1  ORF type:complete len:385 (+),score=44.58 TRINITY_DN92705_c0_g1_i1:125-1156(+)
MVETESVSVPADTYGAFMMSMIMVADVQGGSEEHKNSPAVKWIGINLLLHLTNLALQCALPLILISTSIELREQPYEVDLESYTKLLVDNRNRTLPIDTPASILCETNKVVNLWIYPLVLFVWWSRMVQELADALWLLAVFINIDSLEQSFSSSESEDGATPFRRKSSVLSIRSADSWSSRPQKIYSLRESSRFVVALPDRTRVCAVGLVIVPKVILAFFIAWVGTKHLVFTHHTATLIVKAIVIQWWFSIDELLYRSYVSHENTQVIKNTSFRIRKITTPAFDHYGSTMIRMTLVVTTLAVIYYGVYGPIHAFRIACLEYKESLAGTEGLSERNMLLSWLIG